VRCKGIIFWHRTSNIISIGIFMRINYAISLWNYTHTSNPLPLPMVFQAVRKQGFGIELWATYPDTPDLFAPEQRKQIKPLLDGINISLHSKTNQKDLDSHKMQIDAAADYGARILVLHADDLTFPGTKDLNEELANRAVSYAQQSGVQLALENGQLGFLTNALNKIPGLYCCLDFGHVYLVPETINDFLPKIIHRTAHLHFHDILNEREKHLLGVNGIYLDHYTPGSGGIPAGDWRKLFTALDGVAFQGTAVFEVHPRDPLQTAVIGESFLQQFLNQFAEKSALKEK
jgi:sugar phosphate isomerase/epimerase